jgi:uncharacterized protein (TIGR04222 family)
MDAVLYSASIASAVLIVITMAWTWRPLARARAVSPSESPSLGVYEAALLAGGPRRVADAALVSLVSRGVLRVSRKGTLTRVHGVEPGAGAPAESAVRRHVASYPGDTASGVRHALARHHAVRRLAMSLASRGLMVPRTVWVPAFRWMRRLPLIAVPAAVVAVASLFPPLRPGPLAIAATAVAAAVAFFVRLGRALANPVTKAGRAALEASRVHDADDVWRVALHGLSALPDRQLADALHHTGTPHRETFVRHLFRSGGSGAEHGVFDPSRAGCGGVSPDLSHSGGTSCGSGGCGGSGS